MVTSYKKVKWQPEWYVRVYEMARDGMSPDQVKRALGVSDHAWRKRWHSDPALRDAVHKGRARKKSVRDGDGMPEYVYRHLSPELLPAWKELERVFDVEDHPEAFVAAVLTPYGAKARKALYLHALVCSNFNGSQAGRKTGVSREALRKWCAEDPAFARLVTREVSAIKADMVEGAVWKLIDRGDTAATLWAAKCLLKERGYRSSKDEDRSRLTESLQVKVELDKLSVDELRVLLASMPRQLPPREVNGEVVDSETVLSQEQ